MLVTHQRSPLPRSSLDTRPGHKTFAALSKRHLISNQSSTYCFFVMPQGVAKLAQQLSLAAFRGGCCASPAVPLLVSLQQLVYGLVQRINFRPRFCMLPIYVPCETQ